MSAASDVSAAAAAGEASTDTAPFNGFEVWPDAMQSAITSMGSTTDGLTDAVNELQSLFLSPAAFGDVGSAVGDAYGKLVDATGTGVSTVIQGLRDYITRLNSALSSYVNADYHVGDTYSGLTEPAQTGATTGTPATDAIPAADPLANGRAMTEQFEGRRQHVYTDTLGHPSVGIGFNLDRADARDRLAAVGADYDAVRAGTADLTDAQINALYASDYAAARQQAADIVGPSFNSLTQARQDVITDMTFNMSGKVRGFRTMLSHLRSGDYSGAADAMLDSRWAHQVGNRADADARMMRDGQ
jgi:GH24 family phage-related lysozyme (muramidase)